MPDTLQVGLVSYTDWNKVNTYTPAFQNSHTINANLNPDPSSNPNQPFNPDIIAKFDYARFEAPIIPTHLIGLDFANPNEVSDTEILGLFSYPSETKDLTGWKIWKGYDSDWDNVLNWSGGSLPSAQDSILIPNCGCTEMIHPTISLGNHTYSALKIESGGQIDIQSNASLTADLIGLHSRFINQGTIICEGTLNVINLLGKQVENTGLLDCSGLGLCNFLD
jgi:hypothetical protein